MRMQLRYSLVALAALANLYAQDYVLVQYMHYDEDSGGTTIHSPTIEINKDFGLDDTLHISGVIDDVSGASPTYYDAASGASAKVVRGNVLQSNIRYGDIPYSDRRKAFGLSLTHRFQSRDELTVGYNYSDEKDYLSNEISFEFLHYLDSTKNSSIDVGVSLQKNSTYLGCYLNFRECDAISGASSKVLTKDAYLTTTQIGFTQILDPTSVAKIALFYTFEHGYLNNPYQRVVRNFSTSPIITPENRPRKRKEYGVRLEYDKSINKDTTLLLAYRYYYDDWGIISHTLRTQSFYNITPKLQVGIDLRTYHQTKAKFFSAQRDYFTNERYATSDRRLGYLTSYTALLSSEYTMNKKISYNIAFGLYKQLDYFTSTIYTIGVKYKF